MFLKCVISQVGQGAGAGGGDACHAGRAGRHAQGARERGAARGGQVQDGVSGPRRAPRPITDQLAPPVSTNYFFRYLTIRNRVLTVPRISMIPINVHVPNF